MSKWIDGEWLLNFFEPYPDDYNTPLGTLRACVDDAPTIVRCKECKYCFGVGTYCLEDHFVTDNSADRKIEPNLILPERMERGERFEVGETIVVMNREDYYDLLCESWEGKSYTDTHDEAIKAMATLIKAKTEPQTDCSWQKGE